MFERNIANLISNESEPRTDAEDSVELTETEDGKSKQKYAITVGDAGWFGLSAVFMPGLTLTSLAVCLIEKRSLTSVVSSQYSPRDIDSLKKYFGWVGGGSCVVAAALAANSVPGATLASTLVTGATAAVVWPLVLANVLGFGAVTLVGVACACKGILDVYRGAKRLATSSPVIAARSKVIEILDTPLTHGSTANQNGELKKLEGPK